MIFGIGTDIVEIERIENIIARFGMAFCYKVLHAKEIEVMPSIESARCVPWIAARFAAKEAAVKAMGIGLRNGITLKSVAVVSNNLGKPELLFFDKAKTFIENKGVTHAHVSLSHERKNAIAYVVLEKD